MREFRRFLLDFAAAKYLEDMKKLNERFKMAGSFEEQIDKRVFTRAMISFCNDTF